MAPRRKKKASSRKSQEVPPGTFEPAVPRDTHDVLTMFAVAVRAVCAVPDGADDISRRLQLASSRLTPPESEAARECNKLWQLFVRVAQMPKEALRVEAGRAFCRDLDAIGQRMDLPPLPRWDLIPQGLAQSGAVDAKAQGESMMGESLESIQEKARKKSKNGKNALKAKQVLDLLQGLAESERDSMFAQTVGDGAINRNDVTLLIRFMSMSDKLEEKSMVANALRNLGVWLSAERD